MVFFSGEHEKGKVGFQNYSNNIEERILDTVRLSFPFFSTFVLPVCLKWILIPPFLPIHLNKSYSPE